MITREEALQMILSAKTDPGIEKIPLSSSYKRVLAQPIIADRDFPPFDRVCMDGIAIDFNSYANGKRAFECEHTHLAGSEEYSLQNRDSCVEVMTGSVLPMYTTTVIPYELLEQNNGHFIVKEDIGDKKNIHYQGSDAKKGKVLLDKKIFITAAEAGVLASTGVEYVDVYRLPRVAIISTGDELVDIGEIPSKHQLRRSNVHSLAASLKEFAITGDCFHLNDDRAELENSLRKIISDYDVVLLSGGVSKGKRDFLPEVLEKLHVKKLFHKVKQRPGKPFWFGKRGNTVVFAFPGNPVSTFVCYLAYFQPWLRSCLNLNEKGNTFLVKLAEDVEFKPDLHYFAPARIIKDGNALYCRVIKGNGSGHLSNLLYIDGFIELERGRSIYSKNEMFDFIPFRDHNS